MIRPTQEQKEAINMIDNWFHNKSENPFYLGGLAGTGKSFVISYIHKHRLLGKTYYGAYTGKAALVLQKKGVPATTIHRMIYKSIKIGERINKKGQAVDVFEHRLKSSLDCNCIIIDECSMVGSEIMENLLSFRTPILFVGDHGQLPPVKDSSGIDLATVADFKLETIIRTEDSIIPDMAALARIGRSIPYGVRSQNESLVEVIRMADMTSEMMTGYSRNGAVVLCWRNATKDKINKFLKPKPAYISGRKFDVNDRIICLKNSKSNGLINGMTGICTYVDDEEVTILPDGETEELTGEIKNFDLAYCLTVHKSQGSEYDTVILVDEYTMPQDRQKWLYTGITRAKKHLIIIKG